jgi:hypothetical protein
MSGARWGEKAFLSRKVKLRIDTFSLWTKPKNEKEV